MYKYTLFTVVLFTQLFAQLKYGVGDQISIEHQNMEFDYCYPSDSIDVEHALPENPPDTTFSFSKHAGKVFLLEMSATW